MTEGSETLFRLEAHFSGNLVAEVERERLTTERGSALLHQADRGIGLLRRIAPRSTGRRQPERVEQRQSDPQGS